MSQSLKGAFYTLESGVRIYHRLQGPHDRPVLVLLNGLLSDTTMWAGCLPRLTERFRVLTLDFRGQGRSDAPTSGPYRVQDNAADVQELLEALGIRRPWLLGLSNGSSVALELLSATPGQFSGAVLTSAKGAVDFSLHLKVRHWIQCLELGGALLQFDAAAPYLWGDRFLQARHGVLRAYHQVSATRGAQPELHGARLQMEGILDWDIRPRLGLISDPVLLLAGAEDLLTPPWKAQEAADQIPGARFQIVAGIGHALPVEDPKRYAELALAFIDEVTALRESRGLA